jgi:hypothetical protein
MNFMKVCIRRMSDRYRAAADFARPEKEMTKDDAVSTTTLLARWGHTISGSRRVSVSSDRSVKYEIKACLRI